MTKKFPQFASHADAKCFNCDGPLSAPVSEYNPHSRDNGEYRAHCPRCWMHTWYDLKETEEAA